MAQRAEQQECRPAVEAARQRPLRREQRWLDRLQPATRATPTQQLGLMPGLSTATLQMACGLVVTTMMNAATDFLDLPKDQPQLEREFTENFVRQLRLIFIGARAWTE